jgi:hypothetical protein
VISLVRLDSGFVNAQTNAPQVSAYDTTGANSDDRQPFGDVPLMQCLGVASLPSAPDDSGYAEGIILEDVAGLPGVVVSAWDTRTFSVFGNLEAGDTVLHSTGPQKAAQVLCKEAKRQVVMSTLAKKDGSAMQVIVDGDSGKIQITAHGKIIELGPDGISLENGNCGISLTSAGIQLRGQIQLGGMVVPPGHTMAIATPVSWAIVPGAIPLPLVVGAQ